MAYTVPSGYSFLDKSANKWYYSGETVSVTPADGDYLSGTNNVFYYYYNARTKKSAISTTEIPDSEQNIAIDAGWECMISNRYTGTSFSPFSSIFGKNVVSLWANESPNLNTISSVPGTIQYFSAGYMPALTTISGTMPSSLKYFYARKSTKLKTVPSFANCTSWTYGFGSFENTALVTAPALPSSLKYVNYMFSGCESLTTGVPIPSSAIQASYMYYGCSKLTSAPANNSTHLETIINIFSSCTALTDARNFVVKGANSLKANYIFQNCSSLKYPPTIQNANKLDYAFANCANLESFPNIPASVTSMIMVFSNCSKAVNPPTISTTCPWSYIFIDCTSLTSCPDIPEGCTTFAHAFENCVSITDLPKLPSTASSLIATFKGCTSLTPQNYYIPELVSNISSIFEDCSNYYGIITIPGSILAYASAFHNCHASRPIILTGNGVYTELSNSGDNVYIDLNLSLAEYSTTRCSDMNGTLSDTGQYCRITCRFKTPVPDDSDVYVPKVYIGNAQQTPLTDWKLTNNITGITETIQNSTDISATRILAGDLIADGTFETYFTANSDNVSYKIFIPSSADNVIFGYDLQGEVVVDTKYWNGLGGSAIYTGDTYIFDTLQDGSAFKIGGAIDEGSETGFIVGNQKPLIADQYPSTFNGPVKFNSNVSATIMLGFVQMFAGQTAPTGWLMCDGSAVSRTDYAGLYSVIGDTYGAGNGSTTFNLPDLRNRFPVGAGDTYSLNDKAGDTTATIPTTKLLDEHIAHGHGHTLTMPNHVHSMTHAHEHSHGTSGGHNFVTGTETIYRRSIKPGTSTAVTNNYYGAGSLGQNQYTDKDATKYTGNSGNPTTQNPSIGGSVSNLHGASSTRTAHGHGSISTVPPYIGINFIIYAGA